LKELSGSQLPDAIVIYDKWVGLSPSAPIVTDYALQKDGDQFTGEAHFAAGGYFSNTYKANGSITIPVDVIEAFLKELAKSDPEPGPYTPYSAWTDDYPSIYLEVEYPSRRFEFSTTSQGAKNVPWRLTIDSGAEQVVNSGIPSDALDILRPYIPYKILDELIKQIEVEMKQPAP